MYDSSRIKNNKPITNGEILNLFTQYNDYVITRMRTMWGVKLSDIQKKFGDNLKNYFLKTAQPYIKEQFLIQNEDTIKLSERGTFILMFPTAFHALILAARI